jgi:hypothetical protein
VELLQRRASIGLKMSHLITATFQNSIENKFIFYLDEALILKGNYEVALTELYYQMNYSIHFKFIVRHPILMNISNKQTSEHFMLNGEYTKTFEDNFLAKRNLDIQERIQELASRFDEIILEKNVDWEVEFLNNMKIVADNIISEIHNYSLIDSKIKNVNEAFETLLSDLMSKIPRTSEYSVSLN